MSRSTNLFAIFALLAVTSLPLAAHARCTRFLLASDQDLSEHTHDFIGYLSRLLEERVIGEHQLARLIESAERGSLENPITEEDAAKSSAALVHREAIDEELMTGAPSLDLGQISAWAHAWLQTNGEQRRARKEVEKDTAPLFLPIEFHPVPGGQYLWEERRKGVMRSTGGKIESFELMSTSITRGQWWSVMQGTRPPVAEMDKPVVNVSLNEVRDFISVMNRLSEDGYRYRLPTDAEWDYVVSNLGKMSPQRYFGEAGNRLEDYAWSKENASELQPVATKMPMVIAGRQYFDLLGNVQHWVDLHRPDPQIQLPQYPARGSAYSVVQEAALAARPFYYFAATSADFLGFRLARSRHDR